jgi:hypothetical protein
MYHRRMEVKRITLRIPEHIYQWVSEQADDKGTTVTGEIISILRQEMEGTPRTGLSEEDVKRLIREELKAQK